MTAAAEVLVAALVLASGVLSLVAAVGLLRLRDFFERMHAPSLAATLATWCVALATTIHVAAVDGALNLHAWLVVLLLAVTVPVTTLLLSRAGLFRARGAGAGVVPPPLDAGPQSE